MKKNIFGRKIFAKVRKNNDVIIPYEGDDAVYAVGDLADDADFSVEYEESDRDFKKSFIDVLKGKVKKPEPVEEYCDEGELDSQAEAAFDYFRGITKKIESLKKSVSDAVKSGENKRNADVYIKEVTDRLEEINTMLDARMSEISESAGSLKSGYEQAQGRYAEFTQSIENVTRTTEENVGKINQLSDVVTTVSNRVDEIHTTTNSIDKLYDCVFEFKTSMLEMKTKIEALEVRHKNTSKVLIILLSIALLLAVGSVTLGILSLVF